MRRTPLVAFLLLAVAGCVTPPATPGPGNVEAPAGYSLVCGRPVNATWPEPCVAFASPNDSPSKTEIDLAANPKDPDNVVVGSKDLDKAASPCVWAVAQVTKDGGASWKTSYVGGKLSSRQPNDPLYGWRCITDPIMVFDASGTLYYSLQASREEAVNTVPVPTLPPPVPAPPAPGGGNMYMARSKDGGTTWDKIVLLLPGDGAAVFHDFMRMGWNPKTKSVYTIWNQYTGAGPAANVYPVLVASRDGGETADAPVYPTLPNGPAVENRGMAIAKDGTVHIALDAGKEAFVMTSTDDAKTWSAPVSIVKYEPMPRMKGNNTYRSGTNLELAVDNSGGPRDGWLYATWTDFANDLTDVHVAVSKDKGKTWSAPMLASDGAHQTNDQWMPRPVIDARGTLHLVYFTKEFDAANWAIDAMWAASTDGGATWTHARLTQRSFDGGLGIHQFGGPFIGDYLGIGASGNSIYMGFPTTVTGRAEIGVARVVWRG